MIGSTKAPPFSTTFCPPKPVRTNARSLEERRYSQLSSQTTIATIAATTTTARTTCPSWVPVMTRSPSSGSPMRLKVRVGLGQGDLRGQALHAGGAVEAVARRGSGPGCRSASSGVAIGPPWHSTRMSGSHRAGRRRPRVDHAARSRRARAPSRRRSRRRWSAPCGTRRCRRRPWPCARRRPRRTRRAWSAGRVPRARDQLDLERVAHPGLLEVRRGTRRRRARPWGSSGCPRSPARRGRQEGSSSRNGSVPLTPASTGVRLTTGSTSRAISTTISLALP